MGQNYSVPTHSAYIQGESPAGLRAKTEEWKQATAIVISVDGADNLPPLDLINNNSDPYITIEAVNEPLGPQGQRSSVICERLNPRWVPGEVMVFYFKNPETATLLVRVMDWDRFGIDDNAGNISLRVRDFLRAKGEHRNIRLNDPRHNTPSPSTVHLRVGAFRGVEAMSIQSDVVFEYERWWVGKGWTQDKLPSDPGLYSSQDVKTFADTFEAVVPELPDSWTIVHPWGIYSTSEDPCGWTYAFGPTSRAWHSTQQAKSLVRRRRWKRTAADTSVVTKNSVEWLS